jgi:hypothetical protein
MKSIQEVKYFTRNAIRKTAYNSTPKLKKQISEQTPYQFKKMVEGYIYNGLKVFKVIVKNHPHIYGHEDITIISVEGNEYITTILGVSINENSDIARIKVDYKYVYINLSYLKFNDEIINFNTNTTTSSSTIVPSDAIDSLINIATHNQSLKYPTTEKDTSVNKCDPQPIPLQQPQQQPIQLQQPQYQHHPQAQYQPQYQHQYQPQYQHQYQPQYQPFINPELQYAIQLAVQQSVGQLIPQIKEFIDISIVNINNKK